MPRRDRRERRERREWRFPGGLTSGMPTYGGLYAIGGIRTWTNGHIETFRGRYQMNFNAN